MGPDAVIPPPPPGFQMMDAGPPPPPPGFEMIPDHPAEGAPPSAGAGRFGSITSQAVKGIPIIGALAEKGAAAANAVADPAVDALRGAMGKQPLSPGNYSERYARHLAEMRGADKQFEENHPVLAPALQAGGGTMATTGVAGGAPRLASAGGEVRFPWSRGTITGPPGVTTNAPVVLAAGIPNAGSAVARSALGMGGETLGGQVVRSGTSGAVLGGTDAALRDESGAGGAAIGGITGAAGPVAGRAVGSAVNWLRGTNAAARAPTEQALRGAADANYGAARNSNLRVDPIGLHDLSNTIETDLLHGTNGAGSFHPTQAPETFAVLQGMREAPQMPPAGRAGTAPAGPPPESANGLMALRERLTNAMRNPQNPREAMAAGHALDQIDNYLGNIPGHHVLAGDPAQFSQQLAEGSANHGAAKRSERFSQDVLENASRNADVAHAGENLGNSTRQRLNAVIKSNQRGSELGRGFNEPEIAAMDTAARGDRFTNVLRRTQSMTGGLKRGGVASAIGAGTAMHFGLPWEVGAAVPHAISYGARMGAERRTVDAAHGIDEMIRRRAPASAAANAAEAQRVGTLGETQRAGALASRAAEPTIANLLQSYFGGGGTGK